MEDIMTDKIKRIIKNVGILRYFWRKLDWVWTKHLLNTDVRIIPNQIFKRVFKRDIDWENPKTLIEKIYWLQIYSDTSLWTLCSDKYLVREYVKKMGCEEILNPLYGKWEDPQSIEWDGLPNNFILKTNNSCGQFIIVKDKNIIDTRQTIKRLKNWLKLKYGYRDGQLHYTRIKPCIIAEKLLKNKINPEKHLVDYKIWCFHGEPECVLVVYDRSETGYSLTSYDMEWNDISDKTFKPNSLYHNGQQFPKPESFNKMIEYARKLSQGFPQVRIDFYEIDGKPVFGEMTFTTGFGYYSNEYYNYLGTKINLDLIDELEEPNKPF